MYALISPPWKENAPSTKGLLIVCCWSATAVDGDVCIDDGDDDDDDDDDGVCEQ